jgi:long-chain fatty acid adenylyltransferase FadD28
MTGASITAVLRERASLQPNDIAYEFIDYEQNWDGVTESMTWSQLYRLSCSLGQEIQRCGSAGDRAVILAPQGLDYIVAFLATLEARFIAVPLSVPTVAVHDERVTAVLGDASPSVILTTTSAIDSVMPYAAVALDHSAPAVLEVDSVRPGSLKAAHDDRRDRPDIAYLQYTSGSTRTPAGVMVSNENLSANYEQIMSGFFSDYADTPPPETIVSWLPFYHDMGLMLGLCAGIFGGWRTLITSPISFLQRPARWMQMLAENPRTLSAAPNFAFELAAGRTSDADMAGLDLGDVLYILSGAERVHPATLKRFTQRFAHFNLGDSVIRPSYGLAEATLYVATSTPGHPPKFVHFEPEKLSAGHAKRCGTGTPLASYGTPQSPMVRIVDPDTAAEKPAGMIGELWVNGENVSKGYWGRPLETAQTFAAHARDDSLHNGENCWLRTGDLGFISEGELFIVGRIKDLLIVRGRNHYPDDIEATIQEISGGRVAAIAAIDDHTEKLVALVECKSSALRDDEARASKLRDLESEITSAISRAHGLTVEDVVFLAPGSIPITTSGKVRRATCVDFYQAGKFQRWDVSEAAFSKPQGR